MKHEKDSFNISYWTIKKKKKKHSNARAAANTEIENQEDNTEYEAKAIRPQTT